ncbi:hypothetical protein DOK78_002401 [Enterococcus sp. DIV2402]|uniref:DUF4044 domain-containing protein n=1 Tax=Candidatus Enterococcus lowellii TaxID=2230877 RepID=A0ABZ2SQD3_9ENTE|nr:hypothetical protein [Enterococcus sp. DIV2402]MBO0463479.1 hypothetical protein [Enterococcus sp. DIV2402]
MNRYYYVIKDLYEKSRVKRSLKEIWGKKIKWVYIILTGMMMSILVLVVSAVL